MSSLVVAGARKSRSFVENLEYLPGELRSQIYMEFCVSPTGYIYEEKREDGQPGRFSVVHFKPGGPVLTPMDTSILDLSPIIREECMYLINKYNKFWIGNEWFNEYDIRHRVLSMTRSSRRLYHWDTRFKTIVDLIAKQPELCSSLTIVIDEDSSIQAVSGIGGWRDTAIDEMADRLKFCETALANAGIKYTEVRVFTPVKYSQPEFMPLLLHKNRWTRFIQALSQSFGDRLYLDDQLLYEKGVMCSATPPYPFNLLNVSEASSTNRLDNFEDKFEMLTSWKRELNVQNKITNFLAAKVEGRRMERLTFEALTLLYIHRHARDNLKRWENLYNGLDVSIAKPRLSEEQWTEIMDDLDTEVDKHILQMSAFRVRSTWARALALCDALDGNMQDLRNHHWNDSDVE